MNRVFGKTRHYFFLTFLSLAILFIHPGSPDAATGATPGLAIGNTPFRFVGGFLPGWHWGMEYWSEAADHDLIDSARNSGMTVIHIMLPQFETSLGSYDEAKLQKLDHFLHAAYNANVYVMPSFIQAYGEVTLDPSNPYYHERGIEGIIKDPTLHSGLTLRQHFRNRIAALVNRTNTVNGRQYKDDPTIMAWIVCDEPISAPFNYPNGAPQVTLEELTDWFQETASYIKSLDSNHLVTVWSQPAIQAFFGWTLDYLQALGIPEFDFMYTEDADLAIVAGLVQAYTCTGQTPQYMLDQFLPGKPVVFHPAFTSDCWDTTVLCTDNFATQASNLNLAVPEYFEIGGSGVLIENWGTDLYSSFVPDWAQCREYTDSIASIVSVMQTNSAVVNPEGYPSDPLQFVSIIYGLNISKSGSGSGIVTSNPGGIMCGTECFKAFTKGSEITLAAQAGAGSIFTGWSGGGCSGTGTCEVTMNSETTVTATFNLTGSFYTLNVAKSGSGFGTIISSPAGIHCGSDCAELYPAGQSITLTAAADHGSVFSGWSGGGCPGTGACLVTLNSDVTVTALFHLISPPEPKNPENGATFDACSYFDPPVFEWTSSQSFQKLELQFYTPATSAKPFRVKVKDLTVTQLRMLPNIWKKVLKLPGLFGGEVSWKIVGINKGQPPVESEVFTMTIAAPQPVETPVISPTSKTGLPVLGWGNKCGTKFKAYFSSDPTFGKKKKLSFTDQNPLDNAEYFSSTLVERAWNAIRKLVDDQEGMTLYWYVESWDVIKRYQKTDDMQFTLDP